MAEVRNQAQPETVDLDESPSPTIQPRISYTDLAKRQLLAGHGSGEAPTEAELAASQSQFAGDHPFLADLMHRAGTAHDARQTETPDYAAAEHRRAAIERLPFGVGQAYAIGHLASNAAQGTAGLVQHVSPAVLLAQHVMNKQREAYQNQQLDEVDAQAKVQEEKARRAIEVLKRQDKTKAEKDRDESGQHYRVNRATYQSEK